MSGVLAKNTMCPATIRYISKHRSVIIILWESNVSAERVRADKDTENSTIDNAGFEFFKKCRASTIPVNGPMLQTKAKELAYALGKTEFTASNGLVESFRKRHNIEWSVVCGEAADVDVGAVKNWKERHPDM